MTVEKWSLRLFWGTNGIF